MRKIIDGERGIAYLEGDTHLSDWVRASGRVRAVNDSIAIHNIHFMKQGDWVVDAGAALGDHSLMYQDRVGASGRVLAFEPNPDFFDCLRYNCPESSCFNVALWDQAGRQRMARKHTGNAGAFYIGHQDDGIMINTVALDDLNLPRLDFFKLDIEGAELMALRGSIETLKRCRPLVQCEVFKSALKRCGGSDIELYKFFDDNNYIVAFIQIPPDDHHKEILATPK